MFDFLLKVSYAGKTCFNDVLSLRAFQIDPPEATQDEGGKTAKVEAPKTFWHLIHLQLTRRKDTVSCLAHALGAMNYSDRCILRLHDVVITRKVGAAQKFWVWMSLVELEGQSVTTYIT